MITSAPGKGRAPTPTSAIAAGPRSNAAAARASKGVLRIKAAGAWNCKLVMGHFWAFSFESARHFVVREGSPRRHGGTEIKRTPEAQSSRVATALLDRGGNHRSRGNEAQYSRHFALAGNLSLVTSAPTIFKSHRACRQATAAVSEPLREAGGRFRGSGK